MLLSINNILLILQKIFIIVGSLIYLIFASIVVKQVNNLSKNIYDIHNPIIIAASKIHLWVSVLLVLLAFSLLLYH